MTISQEVPRLQLVAKLGERNTPEIHLKIKEPEDPSTNFLVHLTGSTNAFNSLEFEQGEHHLEVKTEVWMEPDFASQKLTFFLDKAPFAGMNDLEIAKTLSRDYCLIPSQSSYLMMLTQREALDFHAETMNPFMQKKLMKY